MPNTINYVTQFDNKLRDLYGQELTSDALFHSNIDIKVTGAKNIKIPKLTVSGYKDHNRSSLSFNTGSYANEFEDKSLDHDRDIEFGVDPMDVDETNTILSVANIHSRFEKTQAIPELDCYTFSKINLKFKGPSVDIAQVNGLVSAFTQTVKFLYEGTYHTADFYPGDRNMNDNGMTAELSVNLIQL